MTFVLLLLVACGDRNGPRTAVDPRSIAEDAWAREVPFALQGGYSVSIDAPSIGVRGTTRGGLLVHRPNRFRLEIFSPLGSPLFYAASDTALSLYVVTQDIYFHTENAEALLRNVTGGAAGVEDLIALMTGRLPFQDAELMDAQRDRKAQESTFTFAGPKGTRAVVVLDDRLLTNKRIDAYDSDDRLVLHAEYEDYMKTGRSRLPEEALIEVPLIEFTMELEFDGWDELGVIPDAFTLPDPGSARKVDLDELIQKAIEARESGEMPETLDELLQD